jgi:hypothetical protein
MVTWVFSAEGSHHENLQVRFESPQLPYVFWPKLRRRAMGAGGSASVPFSYVSEKHLAHQIIFGASFRNLQNLGQF